MKIINMYYLMMQMNMICQDDNIIFYFMLNEYFNSKFMCGYFRCYNL